MKTKATVMRRTPYAGYPHKRFDVGEVASAKPRRGGRYKCLMAIIASLFSAVAFASDIVTSVTARQVKPWDIVEITVGLFCESNDLAAIACTFVATNSATRAELSVSHIRQVGLDAGLGMHWTRHFIWDTAADLGKVKIDDVALTVDVQGPVQLWENGPYWAPCNVGATRPEECGYNFWWGGTVGYSYKGSSYSAGWVSAKGSRRSFDNCPTDGMSNSQLQSEGYIDATGNLVAEHDAATTYLGAPWRMPTDAELFALINNCTTTWTVRNGVAGRLVTGKGSYAAKSIFLPAAGCGYHSTLYGGGKIGYYWSSTPGPGFENSGGAWYLFFRSDDFYREDNCRYVGKSVRPVRGFAE